MARLNVRRFLALPTFALKGKETGVRYETNESDPASSRFLGEDGDRIELPGRVIDVLTSVEVRSDAKSFHVTFARRILENGRLLRERKWQETIPRAFQ